MLLMTPGPTEIPERVRNALSRPICDPNVDEGFKQFYHSLTEKLAEVYDTDNDTFVLSGSGTLGLEASVASLIEKGDEVLCISNGIYGEGFSKYVEMYGGHPVESYFSHDEALPIEEIKATLEEHDDLAIATLVHCETPTGVLNDLEDFLALLEEEGILTVVDAVSSLGGTPVPANHIDICIGGSQKCFSSPPGLATLSVSDRAWHKILKEEPHTSYLNLSPWKEKGLAEKPYFPYTQPVSNLYALDESLDILLEEGMSAVFARHERVAELCRERGKELGFSLYPKDDKLCSPTVTAFHTSRALEIQQRMEKKHDILLATGLGERREEILRVGHMGHNAKLSKVKRTMDCLEQVLST